MHIKISNRFNQLEKAKENQASIFTGTKVMAFLALKICDIQYTPI
jgi:hypothetical protein